MIKNILSIILLLNIKSSNCQKQKEKYCSYTNSTTPPKTSNCWDWNPVDSTKNLRTGCDNIQCQDAVCSCDAYCCETSWDLACVGYSTDSSNKENFKDNPFNNGCSAHRLCCGPNLNMELSEDDIVGNQVICNNTGSDGDGDITIGYNSIDDLNKDISSLALEHNIELYILCPNTIYELDESHSGIKPIKNTTRIQCGADGSSTNNCTIIGGNSHILFNYSIVVVDVVFQGITFSESLGASLSAWGPSASYASFLDCHWMNNVGYDTVDILYQESDYRRRHLLHSTTTTNEKYSYNNDNEILFQPITNKNNNNGLLKTENNNNHYFLRNKQTHGQNNNQKRIIQENTSKQTSMTIIFNDCSFINNRQNIGVILNVGGIVQLIKCRFISNTVSGVTVGVAGGGKLLVDPQTTFINNTNYFSTLFIDYKSSLTLNIDTTGYNNTGSICNDVFREDYGSSCLGGGSGNACGGSCTEFRK